MSAEVNRPYIREGDWVKAESLLGPDRTEAGVVYRDEEGTLRITKPADADPYAPDGLPVDATWVLIIEWKAS